MIDQSILRAQLDRDNSIQKQRRERVSRMMNKIYEAKITSKQKPFIHTMYQDYQQKFCQKFKGKYMQQAKQAYQRAKEQGSLSKAFGRQSAISSHRPSTESNSSNINILEDLNHQMVKKSTTSEIKSNEIKKIEFSSEIKKQKNANQMMKKKAPQEVQVVSKLKEEPKNKQVKAQQQKAVISQLNQIPRIQIKNEVQKELKKQEKPIPQIATSTIIKQKPINQMQILKKSELPKPQIPISKQQLIKPKVNGVEDQYEEAEQDDGPSVYDMMKKLGTRSQILPSKQENSNIQEVKNAKSHIISHQIGKQSKPKDVTDDKVLQEIFKRQKVDDSNLVKIVVETQKHEQTKDFAQQVKKQEAVNEPQIGQQHKVIHQPLKEQNVLDNSLKDPQNAVILQQMHQQMQVPSSQPNRQQQSAMTILTESGVEESKQEKVQASLEKVQPDQFSTELKQFQQNNQKYEQPVAQQQIVQPSPQNVQIVNNNKTQIEKQMEIPSKHQTEITAELQSKNMSQKQETAQKLLKVEQQAETCQFNDDIENRIDKIVDGFQNWLDKQFMPCEKCQKKEEPQSQSQKNSSDNDQ